MAKVFIGVDPHKLSATIEVVDDKERVLTTGRFTTDKAGYAAMRKHVASYPDRVWAVEGSNGAGRPLAQRLLADGEHVVDVPAKLSARARELDTGHNRKTDAHDAHAVAVVAVRTAGLRVLAYNAQLEALRMLVDRRDELSKTRVQAANRLHRLLAELVPGQGKKNITTGQAKTILLTVRPRDVAGKVRRRLATEQVTDLVAHVATVAQPGADGVVEREAAQHSERHDGRGERVHLEREIQHAAARHGDEHHADRNEYGGETTHALGPGVVRPLEAANLPSDSRRLASMSMRLWVRATANT
jgi:hypothetical protein